MSWRIALGSKVSGKAGIPASILTTGPRFQHESMPAEVAVLLPTADGPARLIEDVAATPALCASSMLGLFLAGPFLNVSLESSRLQRAGIEWIVNLPSVDQQDEEFSRQLPDVGLDADQSWNAWRSFGSAGSGSRQWSPTRTAPRRPRRSGPR